MGVRDNDGQARTWATLAFLAALGGCTWLVLAAIGLEACESTDVFGSTVQDDACVGRQVTSMVVAGVVGLVGIVVQSGVSFRSGRQGAGIVTILSIAFLPLFVVGYFVFLSTRPGPASAIPPPGVPMPSAAAPVASTPHIQGLAAPPVAGVPDHGAAVWEAVEAGEPATRSPAGKSPALSMHRRLARIKAAHTDLDLTQASLLLERFEAGDETSGARLDAMLAGMEDGLQFRRPAGPAITYHDARSVAGDLVQGAKYTADVRDSVVTGNVASGQEPHCEACGGALSGSSKFCPSCGAARPGSAG